MKKLLFIFLLIPFVVNAQLFYNVKQYPFNAKGDGTTDDRTKIQKALDTAGVHSGTVYIPFGTYLMSDTTIGTITANACLHIPSNVTLIVDNNATLKRAASQGDDTYLLINKNSGDSNIVIQGGIWDGNGANNSVSANNAQYGIALYYAKNCKIKDVKVTGIRGTNKGEVTGGESFSIQTTLSSNIEVIGCTGIGNNYSSSGFSFNASNNIIVTNCIAYEYGIGMGFTSWKCRGITFVNCVAYSNYWVGFNTEESSNIVYANCISGGISPTMATGIFAIDSTLGNYCGFSSIETDTSGTIQFVNCTGKYNSASGVLVNNAAHVRIIGGDFTHNTHAGISIIGTSTDYCISGEPYFYSNGATEVELPDGYKTWQSIKDTMYMPSYDLKLGNDNIYTVSQPIYLRPYDGTVRLYNNADNYKLWVYSGSDMKVMLNNNENGQIWGTTVTTTDTIKTATIFIGASLEVSTPVGVASGGTGAITLTGLLKGNGTGAVTAITAGTSAQFVRGDFTVQNLNQAAVTGLTTSDSPTFSGLTIDATAITTISVASDTLFFTIGGVEYAAPKRP